MILSTRGLRALLAAAAMALGACGDGPVEPTAPRLELLVAGGDGQFGTPGERLASPLKVLVRRADTEAPQKGISVSWAVEQGSATFVGAPVGTSGVDGVVSATVTLGATAGAVSIRARVTDQEDATVTFQAFVVDRPELTGVSPATARGGDTITVAGRGFSPTAQQNVVLFSGIRGRVVSVSGTEMRVEVPSCLPPRSVGVTAQLGTLVSSPVALTVTDGGAATSFTAGQPVDVSDTGGFTCLRLPAGRRYLVVAQSAGTVGAAKYGFRLTGLASSPASQAVVRSEGAVPAPSGAFTGDVASRFEEGLRAAEARMVRERPRTPTLAAQRAPDEAPPAVGSQRSFKVLNAQGTFDDVRGVARLVSEKAVLYVDETAPGGGFTLAELEGFASNFDKTIHTTVTGAFGVPSDLDGNERVAILFTPTVNRLTARGADGFIGGFFYGLDLLDREGSNRGEIFYALVPDSAGTFSDPRPRAQVLKVTPAILAHEFQHMVHFNERILKRGAEGTEALWLSEGLAQMAEELVALALIEGGALQSVEEYRSGNRTRAVRYLSDPGAVSLIVATGQGSLAERGAGWLHVLYLWDRGGRDQVLARLTQTTLTGVANVAAATGAPWAGVFSDWAAAVAVEGMTGPRYAFEYPSLSLRDLLATGPAYPLSAETLGAADFSRSGTLWSSSARHYIVVPPASGYVALRLGGEAGGNAPADAALRLRVVPLF